MSFGASDGDAPFCLTQAKGGIPIARLQEGTVTQ